MLSPTLCHHVGMGNMDRVVHTQTYGNDNVDIGDDVNGDVPEVEKTKMSVRVITTIPSTIIQIFRLAKRMRVMMKTHIMARPTFLHNSKPIILSVSQAA